MRSKQLNFFIAPEDMNVISDFFLEKEVRIFNRMSYQIAIPVEYDILDKNSEISQVCLSKNDYLNNISFVKIDEQPSYSVDFMRSCCIEFSYGCYSIIDSNTAYLSRLYYASQYYERNEVIRKNENFIKWADEVLKSFRKLFLIKNTHYSTTLLSKRFIKWIDNTGAKESKDGSRFIIE